MKLSMLRQNIELLNEVSIKYNDLINRRNVTSSSTELKKIGEIVSRFKTYIKFLTTNVEQLIKEEEGNLVK